MTELGQRLKYIILFYLLKRLRGVFWWFYADACWERVKVPTLYFPFHFFLCVLWICIVSESFQGGKPELILENHHFTRWECGNMCQNKKKKKMKLNVSCTHTPLSLFMFGWVHLNSCKRGTWVKQKIGQWPWGSEPVMTRAQLMSILSDFLHSSWARGIFFGEICIMEPLMIASNPLDYKSSFLLWCFVIFALNKEWCREGLNPVWWPLLNSNSNEAWIKWLTRCFIHSVNLSVILPRVF